MTFTAQSFRQFQNRPSSQSADLLATWQKVSKSYKTKKKRKVERKPLSEVYAEKADIRDALVQKLESVNYWNWADKMRFCCSRVEVTVCPTDGVQNWQPLDRCSVSICPFCHERRYSPLELFAKILAALATDNDLVACLLTLSIANQKKLASGITRQRDCMRRFRDTTFWKERIAGGTYRIEHPYNFVRDDWNVHAHCLVLQRRNQMVSTREWREQWKEICGDGSFHVDIRQVYAEDELGNRDKSNNGEALFKAILETLKYPIKQSELIALPEARFLEVLKLKNVHLGGTFGVLYGKQARPMPEDFAVARKLLNLEESRCEVGDTCPKCQKEELFSVRLSGRRSIIQSFAILEKVSHSLSLSVDCLLDSFP